MIKIKNLRKSFDGGVEALKSVSFELNPYEITGHIGVNGAGKSTTIKILSGIIPFDEGEVLIGECSLPEDSLKAKSMIGYVPESPEFFNSLSINEYFSFLKNIRNISDADFVKRSQYFAELFEFKEQMNTAIGKLSKGNKQKVLIVSALLHNPDILLLDEPLNGLDAFSIMTFQDVIHKLAERGKTIFYCSHLLDIMEKVSTRIIILDKGEIKVNALKDELKSHNDYKSLENIFRELNTGNQRKEFSYDEVFS